MFILSECILFIFIVLFDNQYLKYFSIMLCFFYSLYKKSGYGVMVVVLIADYCLLLRNYYCIGVFLFIIIQCMYSYILTRQVNILLLLVGLFPCLEIIGFCYAIMSACNIFIAYRKHHWLFITLITLAICDILVCVQYIYHMYIPILWLPYLFSQVYYVKMVSSK